MDRSEKTIFTTLCMVNDSKGNLLVQNRRGPSWPGIAFPGGHVEPGESFTESVVREVLEETGLTIQNPALCGIKQFPLEDQTRYLVLLYKTSHYKGKLRSSEEGEVFWLPRSRFSEYRLAEDFEQTLEIMVSDTLNELYYDQDGRRFIY